MEEGGVELRRLRQSSKGTDTQKVRSLNWAGSKNGQQFTCAEGRVPKLCQVDEWKCELGWRLELGMRDQGVQVRGSGEYCLPKDRQKAITRLNPRNRHQYKAKREAGSEFRVSLVHKQTNAKECSCAFGKITEWWMGHMEQRWEANEQAKIAGEEGELPREVAWELGSRLTTKRGLRSSQLRLEIPTYYWLPAELREWGFTQVSN